ncbi:MlaD family protein [Winogradskyella immobilis]|uniref:MCE family protein n=1 Tax=Winogradskyella immobilis TaxID=2816852 RepID=A0ABS8EQ43_9FLAO|nr:MlaD family protein [Winogradskyella immobilis]MCC1485348.1 MCE family protein [Winogradskyella immobilis]MCG0017440.1 MlaD family protein [Winogradskyella immobilis]
MKISREIKAAILVITGVLLFVYMFNYLKGKDLFSSTVNFYTEFDFNALSTSSQVTVNGNAIGKVESINYMYETGKTRVSFSVNPKFEFSKSSLIRMYETGIMGGNALAIINSHEGELAKRGDFIASEVQPGLITTLKDNFSGLSTNLDKTLRSADTLMTSLNSVIQDDSNTGLKATVAEFKATLISFRNLSNSIQEVVKENDEKIASVLENFDKTSSSLAELSEDLKKVELSKTINDFDTTLLNMNTLLKNLNAGEGTMGKLLSDEALYNNLNATMNEMEELLRDIKLHPKRYFRILSRKEIPYEDEEDNQKN